MKHQDLSRWRANSESTLTKEQLKYKVIARAKTLFGLSDAETETLANKAGLSLSSITFCDTPIGQAPAPYADFALYFNKIIESYPHKTKTLCEDAMVSERMLRYIRKGRHIKKEAALALLIVAEHHLDTIQECLKKAGFVLSKSLPADVVIIWMLENELKNLAPGVKRIFRTNEVLHSLKLPLLMTRPKG